MHSDRKENRYPKSQATKASELILNADRGTSLFSCMTLFIPNLDLSPVNISDPLTITETLTTRIQELEAEQLITTHKMDTLLKKCAVQETELAKFNNGAEENRLERERLRYFADWLDSKEKVIQARESEMKDEEKRVRRQGELIKDREKRLTLEQDAYEKKMERRFENELNDAKRLQDVLSTCQSLGQMIQYISVYARDPQRIVQRGNDILERRQRNNDTEQ